MDIGYLKTLSNCVNSIPSLESLYIVAGNLRREKWTIIYLAVLKFFICRDTKYMKKYCLKCRRADIVLTAVKRN